MANSLRPLVAALFMLTCFGPAKAEDQLMDHAQSSVERVVAKFQQKYVGCGLTSPFAPTVEMRTHSALISYTNASRKITVSRYDELPGPLRSQMDAWAERMNLPDGAALFATIFQRLGTAHEMGHWQQHISQRYLTLDRWESEMEANRISIAFWSEDLEQKGKLADFVNGWTSIMGDIPNPVPKGQNPRSYFNDNYQKILIDAAQYGWFQGEILRQAWAKRDENDFCELSRINAAAPNDQVLAK